MKTPDRRYPPYMRRLAYQFSVWAFIGIGFGAAFTLALLSIGGEALAFLAFGTGLGVLGGTAFVALCLLQRHRTMTRVRLATSGAVAGWIALTLLSAGTLTTLTVDTMTALVISVCLATGAGVGLLAGWFASELDD